MKALKIKTIEKNFDHWVMADDERYNITRLESHGKTLEELIDNCEISIEDWHGNVARIYWTVEDLSKKDYELVIAELERWI